MRVRGPVNIKTRQHREAAMSALEQGDLDALFRINRAEFGGATMMADSDDEDEEDEDGDDGDSGADDTDSGGGAKDSDKDEESDADDLREENAKLRKRLKANDKRASDLEKRLAELEKKPKDGEKDSEPDAVAQQRIADLETQLESLTGERNRLRLEKAFLTSNKHTWHDADTALDLANSKGYLEEVVDEDGDVDKRELRKALDRLAKEHKYLVAVEPKKKQKDKDNDEEHPPPSGQASSRRSKNAEDEKARKQELKKRFPVLNTR